MRPTRRLWAVGGLAVAVTGLAVVFARPLLLAATALLGAWILARQYLFVTTVTETVDAVTVTQSVPTHTVRTDETTPLTLTAARPAPTGLALTLEAGVPTAGRVAEPVTLSLAPGERTAARTATVEWPIAGRHGFAPARLTVSDGLFETTVRVGSTPTVTVEPRGPRAVHVGAGGDRVALAQGAHAAGRSGSGLEPAELREYVPGDTADRIDWKATARLSTPHVREYESETDRPTMLVVDHRGALATGPPAETKLDYLREVALAVAASAHRLEDPLGLVTVGGDGVTTHIGASTARYRPVRRRLLDLDASPVTDERSPDGSAGASQPLPTAPRAALERLETGPADAVATSLAPFYRARGPAHTRVDAEPLLAGVRVATGRQHGRAWVVICTDDSDPATVRDAVGLARAGGNDVLVLLTPTVLFEPGGLGDVAQAYDRYVSFEEFRRELDRMDRVRALEVAPDARLSTVLAHAGDGATTRGEAR